MFDFTDYTLNELTAIDNFVCYTRAMAAEQIDLPQIRKELMQLHRSLSRAINARLDETAEEWDKAHAAQAERPNAPELTVRVIPRKPLKLEPQDLRKFEELYNDHAAVEAESPADPPDMFGRVNDALDGLQV